MTLITEYIQIAGSGEPEAEPFLVGVAISVYQNSGGPGTNWEAFEDQKNWLGSSVIRVSLPISCMEAKFLSEFHLQAHRYATAVFTWLPHLSSSDRT